MKMLKMLSVCFLIMGLINVALLEAYMQGQANIDQADEVEGGGLESTFADSSPGPAPPQPLILFRARFALQVPLSQTCRRPTRR
jgi:hypothetical protein